MTEKERKKRVRKEVFQSAAEPNGSEAVTETAAEAAKIFTSGGILRQAREERGLSLEKVSSSIHLRVSQIRAIEEGNLSQLPGMTYAVGFVRSYAKFLKLDSEELVTKFKQENGASGSVKPELHFPAPLGESKTPGPMVIGVSTVFVVALLVLWAIFSGGGDTDVAVEDTAAETVVATDSALPLTDDTVTDASAPIIFDETQTGAAAPAVAAAPADAATTAPAVAAAPVPAAAPVAAAPTGTAPAAEVVAAPVVLSPAPAVEAAPVVKAEPAPAPVAERPTTPVADEQIVVKQPKGRVVLQAKETSWVQITDKSGQIIYKKVMKPGEKFFPPDQAGLTMVTSNAGGVSIAVDGAQVNPLGASGDIVRGVTLDPQSLKNRRATRVRNY